MVRFVALDLGNVLCDLDRESFPNRLSHLTGLPVARVVSSFDEALWYALESGRCAEHAFRAGLLARMQAKLDDNAFDDCWNLVPTPRRGADELVARLSVPHAIWSNTDPIHARHLSSMRAVAQARHRHFSFEARVRKPERGYFEAGLAALGADPQDVLFIDDRAENRDAAAALGIVVEGAMTLADVEAALLRHGVLRG